jgi:NTP pyrophosphatase (non-canonical NTP hydrolase)
MGINEFLLPGNRLTIGSMQAAAWENSELKGFHEKDKEVPLEYVISTKLMLAVSELAESLEEVREGKPLLYYGEKGKPEGIAAELADVVIRCGDLAGILGIDLQSAVIEKMNYNEGRPHLHGGKAI